MITLPVMLANGTRELFNLTESQMETLQRGEFYFCRGDSFYRLVARVTDYGHRVECSEIINREEFAKRKSRKFARKSLAQVSIAERINALRAALANVKHESEEGLVSLNMEIM